MKTSLMMQFNVDKVNNKIHVEREFAAPLKMVWSAWTDPKILDQWWAPKPYRTETKTMDFREGGHWLYAMIGPENDTHWCRADYQKIQPEKSYTALDAFCDEQGAATDFPRSLWTNVFNDHGASTIVNIDITYQSLADLEKIIELGFKEGFTMAMENLDALLTD